MEPRLSQFDRSLIATCYGQKTVDQNDRGVGSKHGDASFFIGFHRIKADSFFVVSSVFNRLIGSSLPCSSSSSSSSSSLVIRSSSYQMGACSSSDFIVAVAEFGCRNSCRKDTITS